MSPTRASPVHNLFEDALRDEGLRLVAPHVVRRPFVQLQLAVARVQRAVVHSQHAHLQPLLLRRRRVLRTKHKLESGGIQ